MKKTISKAKEDEGTWRHTIRIEEDLLVGSPPITGLMSILGTIVVNPGIICFDGRYPSTISIRCDSSKWIWEGWVLKAE